MSFGSVRVLTDVNLTVGAGQVVGLVGPNGAGKTTTLRGISAVVKRQSGSVAVDGVPCPDRPDVVARLGIAHVPEGRGLFPELTVESNIRFGAVAIGKRVTGQALASVIDMFPQLEMLLKRKAGSLSGGEQQMVAIGRGLVARPKVLMVDELSLGLAPKIVTDVLSVLSDTAREDGLGLLLVDQNVRALARVCDEVYTLRHGRSGSIELGDEAFVEAAYFGSGDGPELL